MPSIEDERKAVEKAQAVLRALTPSTARTDQIVFALRRASRLTSTASGQGFSSDLELNNIRGDAATALNGVAGSLELGTLTQDVIDKAKPRVAALLSALGH